MSGGKVKQNPRGRQSRRPLQHVSGQPSCRGGRLCPPLRMQCFTDVCRKPGTAIPLSQLTPCCLPLIGEGSGVRRTPWLPSQGPIPPIRGKCPEGTKGVGTLSPKVTERSPQICCNLSVPAFRRAASPERGGFFAPPIKFFVKIPQKSYQILATGGNVWYCYGATPKKPKAGIRFFICRKLQMKCFAGPALAKQMQRRMEK